MKLDAADSAHASFKMFKLPVCQREYKFHPKRRWRFDLAWPEYRIAVEIDGGVYTQGRHTRPTGYIKDLEKFNHAAKMGWRVFKFTPQQVKTGMAVLFMQDVFDACFNDPNFNYDT